MTKPQRPKTAAMRGPSKAALVFRIAAVVAAIALGASFFQPVWWVALTAPNYPAQTFPDGVRINFHVNRISNGCEIRKSTEVVEKEALDCVHEMDTINHFVGMYPIASGGPVEKLMSPFLFAFLGVLIVGFALPGRRLRLGFMTAAFAAIAIWMSVALFTPNGVRLLDKGWIVGLVDSLGRGDDEGKNENLHPVVRQLKESLAKSHIGDATPPKLGAAATKDQLIDLLKVVYDQKTPPSLTDPAPAWTGRGIDVMAWHYEESLGRWFNEPIKNGRLVSIMRTVLYIVYAAVLVAMLAFLWLRHWSRPAHSARRLHRGICRLALVVRPQPQRHGRLHAEAVHADRVRRRQGGAVHDAFLSLHRIRADVRCRRRHGGVDSRASRRAGRAERLTHARAGPIAELGESRRSAPVRRGGGRARRFRLRPTGLDLWRL